MMHPYREDAPAREKISAADMEGEANIFAMELLMPEHLLRKDIERLGGIDLEDESAIKTLARKYKVSLTVMAVRIGQLIFSTVPPAKEK